LAGPEYFGDDLLCVHVGALCNERAVHKSNDWVGICRFVARQDAMCEEFPTARHLGYNYSVKLKHINLVSKQKKIKIDALISNWY
jgi:hypothetical protein